MRIFLIVISLVVISVIKISAQTHELFTVILRENVHDGIVDYKSLVGSEKLNKYLELLSSTDPDKFTKNEKLAFWINAYNAFTLQIVVENYPIKSITSLHTGGKVIGFLLGKTVWDKGFITINNKKYSLNDIEHKILRKMNEPRIHFAIVCASISCPELRNEAFEADRIDSQLQEQTIKFLNDKTRNHFDVKNKKAYISQIFNWFGEDFGDSDENILKFVSEYLPDNIKNDILNNLSEWDVSYMDYDWGLNEYKN